MLLNPALVGIGKQRKCRRTFLPIFELETPAPSEVMTKHLNDFNDNKVTAISM